MRKSMNLATISGHAADPVNNMPSPLEMQRMQQIVQAEEQRRIRYLHALLGSDAATKLRRLRLAKRTALLSGILGGSALGALTGYSASDYGKGGSGALKGALLGAGIGGLGSALANAVGGVVGNYASTSPGTIRDRINNMNELDYILPGRASYVDQQLEKNFLENESDTPKQLVF
jgi:hypothetical protein